MHKHSFFALRPISSFTLMAGRKNQDGLVILLEAVERHVAATATGDEQLAQVTLDGATDQRVTNQWIYRFRNQLDRCSCCARINLDQEIGRSFEIGKRPLRVDQPCQDPAFGFDGCPPAMRALRQA